MLGHEIEPPAVQFPGSHRGGGKSLFNSLKAPAPSAALVYPNPAKGRFQLYHVVPEGVEHVQISIKDALGKELFQKDLSTQGGVADVECTAATGLHFLSLYYDGLLMETLKVHLIK